jgi:hypothetical protein
VFPSCEEEQGTSVASARVELEGPARVGMIAGPARAEYGVRAMAGRAALEMAGRVGRATAEHEVYQSAELLEKDAWA